jgi:hypothetical protein
MYTITKHSISTSIKELEKELDATSSEEKQEDIIYQIDRLESAPKGSILVHIDGLNEVRSTHIVQEGYWTINGKAHYLCIRR